MHLTITNRGSTLASPGICSFMTNKVVFISHKLFCHILWICVGGCFYSPVLRVKYWSCMFLQTTDMLNLYVSICVVIHSISTFLQYVSYRHLKWQFRWYLSELTFLLEGGGVRLLTRETTWRLLPTCCFCSCFSGNSTGCFQQELKEFSAVFIYLLSFFYFNQNHDLSRTLPQCLLCLYLTRL